MASAVVAQETALARLAWTPVATRDHLQRYNPVAIAGLMPAYDLRAVLDSACILGKVDHV